MNTVGVRFQPGGKIYFFKSDFELLVSQKVVVETEQGLAMGEIAQIVSPQGNITIHNIDNNKQNNEISNCQQASSCLQKHELKKVIRPANKADLEQLKKNQQLEKKALDYCRERVEHLQIPMVLVRADAQFDQSKIVIFFTADERLDFRELVHDLTTNLYVKVELRQIGVRQEAKLLGGLGSCGRELCCSSFLQEFVQVGVKMAKEQSLSLNPTKASGLCGRLMCCLGYEYETYQDLCREMPKVGKKITIRDDLEAKVLRQAPLTGQLTLLLSDGRTVTCTMAEIYDLEPVNETANNSSRATKSAALPPEPEKPALPTEQPEPKTEPTGTTKRKSKRSRRRKNKNISNESKAE